VAAKVREHVHQPLALVGGSVFVVGRKIDDGAHQRLDDVTVFESGVRLWLCGTMPLDARDSVVQFRRQPPCGSLVDRPFCYYARLAAVDLFGFRRGLAIQAVVHLNGHRWFDWTRRASAAADDLADKGNAAALNRPNTPTTHRLEVRKHVQGARGKISHFSKMETSISDVVVVASLMMRLVCEGRGRNGADRGRRSLRRPRRSATPMRLGWTPTMLFRLHTDCESLLVNAPYFGDATFGLPIYVRC
jgi:hypothetical protein